MEVGDKRIMTARIGAALGFVCGVIGLLAGLTGYSWKLGPTGWFTGGALLVLIAGLVLADGVIAFRISQLQK